MPGLRFNAYTVPVAIAMSSAYFYFIVYKQGAKPVALPKLDGLTVKVKHRPSVCPDVAREGDIVHLEYTLYRVSNAEKLAHGPVTFKLGTCSAGEVFCLPAVVAGIKGACSQEKRALTLAPKAFFNRKGHEALSISGKESVLMHFTLTDLDSF